MAEERKIIFFDGHCNLCDGFIDFIVKRDKKRQFFIASLQGKTAEQLLTDAERAQLSTVIFKDSDGMSFYKSKAVFRIFSHIGGVYSWLSYLRILPRFLTDFFYDRVAKNRYRLFGKKDTCRLPTAEEQQYFLD